MRHFTALSIVLLCAACASPLRLFHETANYDQFQHDRYTCIKEAKFTDTGGSFHKGSGSIYSGVSADQGIYLSCMALRGYREDPNGDLLPPKGAEVTMTR